MNVTKVMNVILTCIDPLCMVKRVFSTVKSVVARA